MRRGRRLSAYKNRPRSSPSLRRDSEPVEGLQTVTPSHLRQGVGLLLVEGRDLLLAVLVGLGRYDGFGDVPGNELPPQHLLESTIQNGVHECRGYRSNMACTLAPFEKLDADGAIAELPAFAELFSAHRVWPLGSPKMATWQMRRP
jgi:hypothetical protein